MTDTVRALRLTIDTEIRPRLLAIEAAIAAIEATNSSGTITTALNAIAQAVTALKVIVGSGSGDTSGGGGSDTGGGSTGGSTGGSPGTRPAPLTLDPSIDFRKNYEVGDPSAAHEIRLSLLQRDVPTAQAEYEFDLWDEGGKIANNLKYAFQAWYTTSGQEIIVHWPIPVQGNPRLVPSGANGMANYSAGTLAVDGQPYWWANTGEGKAEIFFNTGSPIGEIIFSKDPPGVVGSNGDAGGGVFASPAIIKGLSLDGTAHDDLRLDQAAALNPAEVILPAGEVLGTYLAKVPTHFRGEGRDVTILTGKGHLPLASGKSLINLDSGASGSLIENMTIADAWSPDNNGCAIREQNPDPAIDWIVRNVLFLRNQDSILSTNNRGKVTIDSCEFQTAGAGDAQSHGIYLNRLRAGIILNTVFGTVNNGHLAKSRAENFLADGNKMTKQGNAGTFYDIEEGGTCTIRNDIWKADANCDDHKIFRFGAELVSLPRANWYAAMVVNLENILLDCGMPVIDIVLAARTQYNVNGARYTGQKPTVTWFDPTKLWGTPGWQVQPDPSWQNGDWVKAA